MINFLHNFQPNPIILSIGPIHIYWYGFFIVLGIIAAIMVTIKIARHYKIKEDQVLDLAFWLIIGGVIGARIFHILIEWRYYLNNPIDIFKVWQGGLAIHGAIIAGLIIVYCYAKKIKTDFWKLTSIIVPGLALAQAIGRWGNYFNQELFGRPTSLPWGIFINPMNRPFEYFSNSYFHPTFLYESLGDFLIFAFLFLGQAWFIKKKKVKEINFKILVFGYLILYSVLRFMLEYLRLDSAYIIGGLRHAQITSLVMIIASLAWMTISLRKAKGGALEK